MRISSWTATRTSAISLAWTELVAMGNLGWLGWLIVGLTLIAASFLSWRRGHGQLIQLIQYRVLWSELIGGRTVQFSGKVTAAFEIAWREAQAKRSSHNYHG